MSDLTTLVTLVQHAPTPLAKPTCKGGVVPCVLMCGRSLVCAMWFLFAATLQAVEENERDLSNPIYIGAQTTSYPYSFADGSHGLQGFAIDICDAVTRATTLRVNWKIVPNDRLGNALLAGDIDAIAFWSETKGRHDQFEFSVPVLRLETVIVVRKNDDSVKSPLDLRGGKIALAQRGTVGELYVLEQIPGASIVYAASTDDVLRKVADGECDAAVISRLTAVSAMDRMGLKRRLRVVEGVRGYDVRFCIAVKRGDALLLARFNEGLAVIQRTGEFEEIYSKWFGRFERKIVTPLQLVSYVAAALALLCFGVLWGYLRQRNLRRRIVRQAEEIFEQRSLLVALYEKHPLATVVLEIASTRPPVIIALNPEAARLYGVTSKAAEGFEISQITLLPELRAVLEDAAARCRTGQFAPWEVRLPIAQRLLEMTAIPLGSRSAEIHRFCILSSDVMKRRLMDEEIAKSRRLRALGELVGGIAHEFNNLLTPILTAANMLQSEVTRTREPLPELNLIEEAARRAADLTRRLLTFGRKSDEATRHIRLSDVVADCQPLLKTMIDRRVKWENSFALDLPPIWFNATDLSQIIFNLVLNARDTLLEKLTAATTDSSWQPLLKISIAELPPAAHRPSRSLPANRTLAAWQCLIVADNGQGIPAEIIERIFEPFFTTKEVGKGTGLGLSTVWHQVTEAHGDIVVETKVGEGSAFHIYFPRWSEETPAPQEKPSEIAKNASTSGARIFLVDDEVLVAKTATALLKRSGYHVEQRWDSLDAWEHLKTSPVPYDLLLLDISMPRMSGLDLARRMRESTYSGHIIIMSGRISEQDNVAMSALDVDCFLAKPFTAQQLLSAVAKALPPPRAPDSPLS